MNIIEDFQIKTLIMEINTAATVALEKLKKYYRHANSNAYPITTSKFYLLILIYRFLIYRLLIYYY
jgi:hypothetical protein